MMDIDALFKMRLGPVQIPPLAPLFGMTDRVTGTVYYPSVTADGTHIIFNSAKPTTAPIRIYGPYDGPFVGQYNLRMGISSGRVVVDVAMQDAAPGPFVRGLGTTTITAGFFGLHVQPGNLFDHLAFISAPTQGSVFDPTP